MPSSFRSLVSVLLPGCPTGRGFHASVLRWVLWLVALVLSVAGLILTCPCVS